MSSFDYLHERKEKRDKSWGSDPARQANVGVAQLSNMSALTLNTQTSPLIGALASVSWLPIGQRVPLIADFRFQKATALPTSQNPRRGTSCASPITWGCLLLQLGEGWGMGT